jgi:hypothetical protein
MPAPQVVTPSDLFVVLERAFRRRTRQCSKCAFSLPYRLPGSNAWAVDAAQSCSSFCRLVLEDLIDEFQGAYRLNAPSRFRTH